MDKKYKFNSIIFHKCLRRFKGNFATQQEKADALGISQSSLSRLQNGMRDPTIQDLVKISSQSGVSPADFFDVDFN